jgi:hypothetical protein
MRAPGAHGGDGGFQNAGEGAAPENSTGAQSAVMTLMAKFWLPVMMASPLGAWWGGQGVSKSMTAVPWTCLRPMRFFGGTPMACATSARLRVTLPESSALEKLQLRLANGALETPPWRVKKPCGAARFSAVNKGVIRSRGGWGRFRGRRKRP